MKFSKIIFILCLWLLIAIFLGSESAVADPRSKTGIEDRLSEIFSSTADQVDLTETLILISQYWDGSMVPSMIRGELGRLTESIRNQAKKSSSDRELIEIIRKTIHVENLYQYTRQVDGQGIPLNPQELFLHGLLKTRGGYCMTLSLLYLILGERLELPLYGVALPNHFFVRYESGSEKINIETTESGVSYPDSFYRQRFGLNSKSSTRFFLNNLNQKQTLGAYISNVGMAYYKSGKTRKAIFYLKPSTKINPFSIEAHNNLANIYSETKQVEKAIGHYKLALEADPTNVASFFNLGLAYLESGNKKKATDSFLEVTHLDRSFSLAHQYLAKIYLENEKYRDALFHFKELKRLRPEKSETAINIGMLHLKLKQYALALEIFKQAQDQFPRNTFVLGKLAETYYNMKNYDRAVEQYRYMVERFPDSLEAYVQLGWTYYMKGEIALASVWTQRGLELGQGPEKLIILASVNLGFYSVIGKNYSQAKQHYRKALSSKLLKTAKDVTVDLVEAEKVFPERTDLQYFVGWIYFESGNNDRALKNLTAYLKKDPGGEFAEEARSHMKRLTENGPGPAAENSISDEATPSMNAPEGMVKVLAGFFIMGSDHYGDDEAPKHKVYLDAFFIDKHEVAAKDFAEFLNAVNNTKGYYLDNKFGTLFYDGRFHPRKGLGNYPINNVKWYGAETYCKWKGKRLPTEAEWEKAARGTDGSHHPWGNEPPTSQRARYFQSWAEDLKHNVMVPVDTMPDGKSIYGLHHMAGNVKEWVDDWFDRDYYKDRTNHINPKGPIGGEFKVLRGGSWRDLKGTIYSSFRNNSYPDTRLDDYGIRCAKSADENKTPKTLTQVNPSGDRPFVRVSRLIQTLRQT